MRALMAAAAAATALAVSLASLALAASTAPTASSMSSSKLGEQIVVNGQGRTLYALSPETTHHLLCKSSECLKFWPPLTVHSRKTKLKAGPGVHGHLGILSRSGGMFQVTLRGMPLYRFSGDHAKGQVNGQGLKSFGGTWHAATAAADPSKAPASTKEPESSAPSTSNPSGGGYESPGTNTTATSTSTTPPMTTSTEEKAAQEKREAEEKAAREKRKKEEEEYKYPEYKY
jgi:predicted lipoprotein with Yx(FWY)xxD motif